MEFMKLMNLDRDGATHGILMVVPNQRREPLILWSHFRHFRVRGVLQLVKCLERTCIRAMG